MAIAARYDALVGAAVLLLVCGVGTLGSTLNPFATGIASGLATVSMPIMAPLADFVNVPKDLVVTAYQSASGLMNLFIPTSAVAMGGLAIAASPTAATSAGCGRCWPCWPCSRSSCSGGSAPGMTAPDELRSRPAEHPGGERHGQEEQAAAHAGLRGGRSRPAGEAEAQAVRGEDSLVLEGRQLLQLGNRIGAGAGWAAAAYSTGPMLATSPPHRRSTLSRVRCHPRSNPAARTIATAAVISSPAGARPPNWPIRGADAPGELRTRGSGASAPRTRRR
jgi:hypothetical protein